MTFDLTAEDKIRAARVQLQKDNPFFGYLVMHLDLVEDGEKVPTAGVDFAGNLYYNPEFVDSLTVDQCKGLVCHEVMHLALKGKMRMGGREAQRWNIAQDAVINNIIKQNGFELPENGITPDSSGNIELTINGEKVEIMNLDDHSFESVYEQLPRGDGDGDAPGDGDEDGDGQGGGGSGDDGDSEGFDRHIYDGDGGEESAGDDGQDWDEIVAKASSQSQGDMPSGLEGKIEAAKKERLDWRQVLQSLVTRIIPYDYTYQRPSSITQVLRQQGHNVYLPDTKKEHIDVVVALDTSGSMGEQELKMYLGELISIVGAFESVKLTVIQHTSDVYAAETFDNPSMDDFEELEIQSGGTSHVPVYEWIEDNMPDARLLVNFTDGFTTVPSERPYSLESLWVLDNYSVDDDDLPGKVVRILPEEEG